ncbi:MAG: indolepyruvate ferredoxin oxidoreductase family protein, partial [Gammaproteobacteria bacterium]
TLPVNITYKILYNDAVAMTGGQPVDGPVSVTMIARQLAAEGVARIALVSEDPRGYAEGGGLPDSVTLHERSALDEVQRELRGVPGVSVIIYAQTCAAEKRRRRKKKELAEPQQRLFINELVCEGCGDCGTQSNCTSILPKDTELGRKRMIDQSSCNKDYSCVNGFCPSFVTVTGATVRRAPAERPSAALANVSSLATPETLQLQRPFNILITGIGGSGVITIGALLGMAAHLEGKGVSVLDMTGMSQKNGAVTSHVRLAPDADSLHAQRIATGEADLVLGCDLLTAGGPDAIAKMRAGRTLAVVNAHEQPTGHFAQNPDWRFPGEKVRGLIDEAVGHHVHFIDATRLASALMGDSIAANLFLLGYAFQRSAVPLSEEAIFRAVELNGVAVDANKQAFQWGRLAASDLDKVQRLVAPSSAVVLQMPESLDGAVRRRSAFLYEYQGEQYARRFEEFVEQVREVERRAGFDESLSKAVAQGLFKLMAYKDEYEVARLYCHPTFREQLAMQFEGDYELTFNLAPPGLARKDARGRPVKRRFGPWMMWVFKLLARMKRLRGTPLDPFGRTGERRMERELIVEFRAAVSRALEHLCPETHPVALQLAELPEKIRGFGDVKAASVRAARAQQARLLEELDALARAGAPAMLDVHTR